MSSLPISVVVAAVLAAACASTICSLKDLCAAVAPASAMAASSKLYGVFLYTDIDTEIRDFVKNNSEELDKLTGDWCEVFVLETTTKLILPYPKPDKNEAYTIAEYLNILPNQFPCLVLLSPSTDISTTERLIIPITEVSGKFFREVFSVLLTIIQSTNEGNNFDAVAKSFDFESIKHFLEKHSEKINEKTITQYTIKQVSIMINKSESTSIDMTGDRTINTSGGNYNERIEGDYVQGNKCAGQPQSLAHAAAEIQTLLKQLEQTYPTTTTSEQMVVAAQAVNQIESNPLLKQRVVNAIKEGSLAAFEKAIDNPAGAFVVHAIQGWQEVK